MKLSTAIRRGAKISGVEQGVGAYVYVYKNQRIKACALGAAFLATHPEEIEKLQDKRDHLSLVSTWLKGKVPIKLQEKIVVMNDDEELSFNQIAYRLERDPNLENPEVS